MKDFYQILGVSRTASQDEIKKAFRTLAHQHHPDKEGGDDAKFKEVNEAYQTLSNTDKRRHYDQFGQAPNPGSGGQHQRGGNPFGGGFGQGGVHVDFEDLGDLGDVFNSFFGGGGRGGHSRRQTRGADVEIELMLEFSEAIFGVEKKVIVKKRVACSHCSGQGSEPGSNITTCQTCQGQGRILQVQQTMFGNFQSEAICPNCRGEGRKADKPCGQCRGQGVNSGSEEIKITVPAGVDHGQSLRLTGKGEPLRGGTTGDLYVRVKVRPSLQFKREGQTIRSTQHISIKQAIIGDQIMVDTVDGPVKLTIPAGTQSQAEFKIKGKGIVEVNGRGRGDQIVTIVVDIPRSISKTQRQALDSF